MSAPAHIARENGKKGGRPVGSRSYKTIERELVLQRIKDRVDEATDVLIDAQLTIARGLTYLYKIEKEKIIGPKGGVSYHNKRPELVTSQAEIESYLTSVADGTELEDAKEPGATYYYITTVAPENKAIDSLLDRRHGKATRAVEMTGKDGEKLIPEQSPAIDALTNALNAIYKGTSFSSDGGESSALDDKASD